MDIGDLCDICEEGECMLCPYGNPCLGCADYDERFHYCKSNGGCGKEGEQDESKTD